MHGNAVDYLTTQQLWSREVSGLASFWLLACCDTRNHSEGPKSKK